MRESIGALPAHHGEILYDNIGVYIHVRVRNRGVTRATVYGFSQPGNNLKGRNIDRKRDNCRTNLGQDDF